MPNITGDFNFDSFAELPLLDGHCHVWEDMDLTVFRQTLDRAGAHRFNALSISQLPAAPDQPGTLNDQALRVKQSSNGRAFAFGSLDYSHRNLGPEDLVAQAQVLQNHGFDGIKMWEGKPSVYIHLPDRLEGSLYASYWKWAEASSFPITFHMTDPLRFWDPSRVGLDRWLYVGDQYPTREELYTETEHILARHPHLRIIFAHFLFFWDNLPRAARFLDAHPSVAFDLTPAVAGYIDLSENRDAAREFFLRFQDRLIYGTDIGTGPLVDPNMPFKASLEIGQAWLVRAFLESDCDIPLPAGIGVVTNQFVGKRLRGIALPSDVLEKIYWRNFERVVGHTPRTTES